MDDVLAEILLRLPPNTRRRLRLVCRHWRDVVDTRTPTNLRSRAKTLIVISDAAYVVDDLSAPKALPTRNLWTRSVDEVRRYSRMRVIGTCNGLVCLCDDVRLGGAITIANPATEEELAVPRLALPRPSTPGDPPIWWCSPWWHDAYSFAYLQATGRYAVVHVPCCLNEPGGPFVYDAVQVFTLGETSWRDVPVPAAAAASCDIDCGVISIDGVTYWVASDKKVMSFDVADEHVACIMPPPSVLSYFNDHSSWHLADVCGRLGIVFPETPDRMRTEVWVTEGATEFRWSLWYIVRTSGWLERRLTRPLLVIGEQLLTWDWRWLIERGTILYRHTPSGPSDHGRNGERGAVEIWQGNPGTVVANIHKMASCFDVRRVFAYVETNEPLSVYMSTVLPHRLTPP